MRKAPRNPTKEEREAHECAGHVRYRAWCEHCIKGRGRSGYKLREEGETHERISMDYGYLGKKSGKTQEGEESEPEELEEDLPILVARTRGTRKIAATMVPRKGGIHTQYTGPLKKLTGQDLTRSV